MVFKHFFMFFSPQAFLGILTDYSVVNNKHYAIYGV